MPLKILLVLKCSTKVSEKSDMAKIQIKSEKITPFGGIFHVREQFSRFVGPVIVLFPILLQSLRLCLSNLSDSTVLLF